MGYEALEAALLERMVAALDGCEWESDDAPAMPLMNVDQALRLMSIHRRDRLDLEKSGRSGSRE